MLNAGVKRFNHTVVKGQWEEEEDLGNVIITPITILDDIITINNNAND